MGFAESKVEYISKEEILHRDFCVTSKLREKESNKNIVLKVYNKFKILKVKKDEYINKLAELNKIHIPHICRIDEVIDDRCYLSIKMLKYSISLDKVNPVVYFRESGIEYILKVICKCIGAFHSNNLVYGNLKPSNMLIKNDSSLLLSDYFGNILTKNLSRNINDLSYMSPEMIKDEEISEKSDIWSIGCVIYYTLSGKSPFEGETEEEVKTKILKCKYKKLYCRNQNILNLLIYKLICENPIDRISITQLKEEIENIKSDIHLPVYIVDGEYDYLLRVAHKFFKQKQYLDSIMYYTKSFEFAKDTIDECYLHFQLGIAYFHLSYYKQAIESFKDALTHSNKVKDKTKCDIYVYIGKTYFKLNQYDKAIEALKVSLKHSSDIKDIEKCKIYYNIGGIYFDIKQYRNSLIFLKQALIYDDGMYNDEINEYIKDCVKTTQKIIIIPPKTI